ncbi:MAG TPA: biotin-dependent carboxyltransferase family protein [Actinomycetales bacterium]|nr:biotin-dependent carboxyltransferase family protein [Actinomycetales bacterium]
MRELRVLATGPLTTVQDVGRPGLAHLGVSPSGAADRGALALANRLVGNPESAAGLEVTLGSLVVRARGDLLVALTGAPCPVDGPRDTGFGAPVHLGDGEELHLGTPDAGLRSYLAVRGGLVVAPVLGSRSTDLLSGLGPPVVAPGDELSVGGAPPASGLVDLAPARPPTSDVVALRVILGPRDDWLERASLDALLAEPWEVTGESNRVGARLAGPRLEWSRRRELASEGVVRGALQVPPSGQPVLFGPDHPVTGGYPVVAVVVDADLDLTAQVRPGQHLQFTPAPR